MIAVLTAPEPTAVEAGASDELAHFYCCDKTVAFCGADISDAEDVPPLSPARPDVCVVCADLAQDVPEFPACRETVCREAP